jgi:hypothetical protein
VTSLSDALRWDAALTMLAAALRAGRLAEVAAAFRQAMAELGIPDHPDGECPDKFCPCVPFEPLVMARVAALLAVPAGAEGAA